MGLKQWLYRAGSIHSDLTAAAKGPKPLAKRLVRKTGHKYLARAFRKMGL